MIQLADMKGQLKKALVLAKAMPQHLIDQDLFAYGKEKLLENLEKELQELQQKSRFLDNNP